MVNKFSDKVSFIWSVADLLRGPYRPNQYGRVILPLTVLRRLDCVLEPTKDRVLKKIESLKGGRVGNVDPILNRAAGVPFHNTSRLTFERLKDDPGKIARNLASYIKSFSANVRGIFDRFGFEEHIARLDEHNRLFLVVSKFWNHAMSNGDDPRFRQLGLWAAHPSGVSPIRVSRNVWRVPAIDDGINAPDDLYA